MDPTSDIVQSHCKKGIWKAALELEEQERIPLKDEKIKLFAGNAHPDLARAISEYIEVPLSRATVSKFTNDETRVQIEESVRGYEVFVIQSMCYPVNDSIMELLIMVDALARASASVVNVVAPYFGYAKQEKKTAGREPISAKLVANLLTVAGANRVITMDLHAAAIQGFFDIPLDNLFALPLFEYYYKEKGIVGSDVVVVSPDAGGVARARHFAERLNATMAIIFKRRPEPDMNEIIEIVGDVKGKRAIIIDDMISTAGTLVKGAEMIRKMGAEEIYACATHPILAGNAVERIINSPIDEVAITDTIPIPLSALNSKFCKISVAGMFGEAIRRNFYNFSMSKIFF
jgi:ribose-phosphate pyrophosphokinase